MRARVAELADALDLGSSVLDVWVRVPSRAPLLESGGRITGAGKANALRVARSYGVVRVGDRAEPHGPRDRRGPRPPRDARMSATRPNPMGRRAAASSCLSVPIGPPGGPSRSRTPFDRAAGRRHEFVDDDLCDCVESGSTSLAKPGRSNLTM